MKDQYILYEDALKTWINTHFSSVISRKGFKLMVGTHDRAFSEYVTVTSTIPDGRPSLPRIAITIEDPELDLSRSVGPETLRKLGWTTDGVLLRSADYPVPKRLLYTLNFWTEYQTEMNLYAMTLDRLFRFEVALIDVDLSVLAPSYSGVYIQKKLPIYLDSGFMNTGDLEPGNKERIIRRTANIRIDGYIWDEAIAETQVVREVEFDMRDYDTEDLFETVNTPKSNTLFAGDGITTSYPSIYVPELALLPIEEYTVFLDCTIGGTDYRLFDDGAGNITGSVLNSGTINYTTGECALDFTAAPDLSTNVTIAYYISQ